MGLGGVGFMKGLLGLKGGLGTAGIILGNLSGGRYRYRSLI